jgi:hypothetical protein
LMIRKVLLGNPVIMLLLSRRRARPPILADRKAQASQRHPA